ncbi:MAG: hypothetical protein IJ110_05010, partial [Lachnospiraceae bacterium]|nr:hypothetical protein [Lachnospiraceae bacterium]
WGFPYSVVWCGNLTIPNYEKYFHCFLIVNKVKLRHSPGRPSRSDFVQAGCEEYASFECLNKPSRDIVLEETASWVRHIRGL